MTEMVTGTPAIVGFTNGNGYENRGWDHGGYAYARSVDAGEQTRDLLTAIYTGDRAGELATEKTGAASLLATEKTGAALHVQIANAAAAAAATAAANQQAAMMYANTNASTLAAQIAACCCETKELIRSVEADRIRDQLALLQTQFMMVTGGLSPAGKAS